MAAGSIVIDLLMRTGAFETDTKRAEKRLQELKKEAQDVGKAIGAAFAVVGAATAALVKSSIDAADSMSKLAQRTGVTTEALSSLALAAKLSDVSNEQLARSFSALSQDAATGGEKLRGLGIAVKDASGNFKTADQLFNEVADTFAKLPDGVEKTNAAIRLFGERVGPQLLPLLNNGKAGLDEFRREAERLGIVIDSDFAKAAEQFNDNITKLKTAFQGVGLEIAKQVVPAVNSAIEAFLAGARAADSLFVALTALAGLNPFRSTKDNLAAARAELEKLLKAEQEGAERRRFTGGPGAAVLNALGLGGRADLTPRIQQLQAQIAALESLEAEAAQPPRRTGTLPPQPTRPAATTRGQQQISFEELLARNAAARERIAQQEEETATRLYNQQVQFELDLAATRSLQAQARIDEAENAANAFIRQQQAEAEAIRDKLDPLREYERGLQRIADLEAAGFLTSPEAVAAVAQLSEQFRRLGRDVQNTNDIGRSLGLTFTSAFEAAITGGRSFRDIVRGIEQDLLRLGTRKLITEPLLGAFEGLLGGTSGGGLGNLFGSISSGIGGFFGGFPAFATGTDFVPRTGLALVHQGERIIPAAENARGAGRGGQIVINVTTPDANSFRASSSQIAARLNQAVAAGARNL